MAEEGRPPLGREALPPHGVVPKQEDDPEQRHRPQPLQLPQTSVTLPSFREAYGNALGPYPSAGPPQSHQPYVDPLSRPGPAPRPSYPDSPNGSSRPGPLGPPPGPPGPPHHVPPPPSNGNGDPYARYAPEQSYRDSYNYPPYHPAYSDRPPAPYWQQMPPNYQSQAPESAPRQRTSIACKYCRKRKIRCSGYQNTPDGKCSNCKKTGNDCVFQPVSSTTSTAFVPVSAIQGGVPPGTPLYGAFGQPLGPNGGRGPTNGPTNGGPPGPPPGHAGMNGSAPPPGYGPSSPSSGYYHHPQHPQHPPHPQHLQHQQHPQHPQHLPPPPMDHNGPPPPGMALRSLPLPYPHGNSQPQPQSQPGYPGDDRRRNSTKRLRDEEEAEYASQNRLPPPPPYGSYYSSHDSVVRHSPPSAHHDPRVLDPRGPPPTLSPTPNGHHYGHGAVLPPPPTSSVGTDTSVRSTGSVAGTAATSPVERTVTRSPSGEAEDPGRLLGPDRYLQQPHTSYARDCDLNAGRDVDRYMLNRLGNARPDARMEYYRGDQPRPPHLLRERV